MKQKSNYFSAFSYLSKKFYCYKLQQLLQCFKRRLVCSILLIQFKYLELFIIAIFHQRYKDLEKIDKNMSFIGKNNILQNMISETYFYTLQGVFLILHVSILVYILYQYFLFIYKGYDQYQLEIEKSFKYKNIKNSNINNTCEDSLLYINITQSDGSIAYLMSMLTQSYQYILQIPILYISLVNFSNMSILNVILSSIIGFIIVDNDYDYSIKTVDYLAKPFSNTTTIMYMYEIVTIALITNVSQNVLVMAFYLLANGVQSLLFCQYYKDFTKKWSYFNNIYGILVLFIERFALFSTIENSIPSIVFPLIIPFAYKIACLIQKYEHNRKFDLLQQIFSNNHKAKLNQLDKIMRLNIFEDVDSNNANKKRELNIHNLLINWNFNRQQDSQFKKQKTNSLSATIPSFQNIDDYEYVDIDDNSFKYLLREIILGQSRKKSESSNRVIYLIFLLEIMDCMKSYWFEFAQLKKKKMSLKEEQIIISIHLHFLYKKEIIQSKYKFQSPFDCSFQDVLIFEERIKKMFEILDNSMKIKVDLLTFMKQKQIIATNLLNLLHHLKWMQNKLKQGLNQLALINNNNPDLLSLQLCYKENLSFNDKDIKVNLNSQSIFNNNQSYYDQSLQRNRRSIEQDQWFNNNINNYKNIIKNDKDKIRIEQIGGQQAYTCYSQADLFDKDSCVVFAVVDQKINLVLKKVSKNFSDIFGMSQSEVIGKNIDIIMPKSLPFGKKHKQYVSDYFKKQELITRSMLGKIIFGSTQKGYIIPLYIDIRLNYHHEIKDIGFCAQIRQIKDSSDYILFNSANLHFMGISQELQELIFSKYNFNQKYDIGQIFPFLYRFKRNTLQFQKTNEFEKQNTSDGFDNLSHHFDNALLSSGKKIKDEHQRNKFKNTFEFLILIKNKKDLTTSSPVVSANLINFLSEKDYSFYSMEITICQTEYKNIDYLSYLKISKIKILTPYQNGPVIASFIKEHFDIYLQVFQKSILERIIFDVENKYSKTNSLFESKNNLNFIHSLVQLASPKSSNLMKKFNSLPEKSPINMMSQSLYVQQESEKFIQTKQNIQINEFNSTSNEFFQIQINRKTSIQEITEEDQSVSSVSGNVSDIEEGDKQTVQEQQIELQMKKQFSNKQQIDIFSQPVSPPSMRDTLGFMSGNIRSSEAILNDEHRLNALFNQKNSQICEYSEFKFITDKDVSIQESVTFHPPILSPNQTAQSNIDLMRTQPSDLQNSVAFHPINRRESSFNIIPSFTGNTLIMENSVSTAAGFQQKFYQDKESFNIAYNNEYYPHKYSGQAGQQSPQTKVQRKNQVHKPQQVVEQQAENASTKSRETSTSTKRILINVIKAESKIFAIKVINFMGLLAFLVLVIVAIQQYLTIMDSLQSSQDNLGVQDWPQETQIVINRVMKNSNILALIRQNETLLNSTDAQAQFDSLLLNNLLNSKDEFTELLLRMESSKDDNGVFSHLAEVNMTFKNAIIYNPYASKVGINSTRGDYYSQSMDFSLLYSYVLYNMFVFRYSINPNARVSEYLVITNLDQLVSRIGEAQNKFLNIQYGQDQQVQNQLTNLIIIILIVSAFCISIMLPLYSYIQQRKDKIISLFSTFPAATLQIMISKMRSSYYQNKYMSSHIKHIPIEIQNKSQNSNDVQLQKKQVMSTMTKLPKINILLILILIIIYFLLSSYPIINKILTQKYIDIQQNNLQIFIKINAIREYVQESAGMFAFALVMKLYPDVKVVKLQEFMPRVNQIFNKTDSILDYLQDISRQDTLSSRYNEAEFDNFFFPLLEDNICNIMGNNPQYILNHTRFQPDFCRTIQDGFLQKGLKLSVKKFTNYISDFYSILNIEDPDELIQAKQNFLKTMNIIDYYNFISYLEQTLNIMKSFINESSTDYFDYIIKVQLALIIYQMILMTLAFGIGWNLFSNNLAQEITKTKQYIQVINIYYLLENNYILTFIKNNHQI